MLSSLSKVLEKLVYNIVYAFFRKHNISFEAQFGFRKNSSTSHAANMLVEKITQAFECKKKALCVFIDFPRLLILSTTKCSYLSDIIVAFEV